MQEFASHHINPNTIRIMIFLAWVLSLINLVTFLADIFLGILLNSSVGFLESVDSKVHRH